jgi:hypothetical protein
VTKTDASLPCKLQLKNGRTFNVLSGPEGYEASLRSIGVEFAPCYRQADVIQFFVTTRSELIRSLTKIRDECDAAAVAWLTYPKLSGSMRGELNRDLIRRSVIALGFVTVAQIAVDADWSALRLKRK